MDNIGYLGKKMHFPDIYEQFHQIIKQSAIFCKGSVHLVDKYKMIKKNLDM